MRKSLMIPLGLILLAILAGQSYMIYDLKHQLGQFTANRQPISKAGRQTAPARPFTGNLSAKEPWDPYREMQRMHNDMEALFGNALSRYHMNQDFGAYTKTPALDLKAEPDRYIIKMDMPGADASSLTISLEERTLSISMKTDRMEDAGNVLPELSTDR